MGETPTRPIEQAERESQREDVERARLGNALGDEVARQPVPHADLAGDVEKEEEPEQKEQRPAEDGAGIGEDEARGCRWARACVVTAWIDERDDGERGDGVAEADPVALEEIGGDEGRGQPAEAEEEIDQVERGGAMRRR